MKTTKIDNKISSEMLEQALVYIKYINDNVDAGCEEHKILDDGRIEEGYTDFETGKWYHLSYKSRADIIKQAQSYATYYTKLFCEGGEE